MCSGRVGSSSCSTSGTRCVTLVTNPEISYAVKMHGESVGTIVNFSQSILFQLIIQASSIIGY
jgi:hypothetical protein